MFGFERFHNTKACRSDQDNLGFKYFWLNASLEQATGKYKGSRLHSQLFGEDGAPPTRCSRQHGPSKYGPKPEDLNSNL